MPVLIFRKPIKNQKSIEILFTPLMEDFPSYTLKNDYKNTLGLIRETISLRKKYNDFHITGDCHYFGLFLFGKNVTHTYHDFNYLSTLKGIKHFIYKLFWLKIPILLSKRIVFVSPFTNNSAMKLSTQIKKKSIVINNCVPKLKKFSVKSNSKKKILAFNTNPQKNISTLLSILKSFDNIELHLIGNSFLINTNRKIYIHQYSDLSHNELECLYNKCDLLWFVSLHEGFGMPVIEAQQIGLPVITSKNSSLEWVSGGGAIFVNDPTNLEENIQALKNGLYNKRIINEIVKLGKANIGRFSINKFHDEYLNFFEKVFK